MIVTEKTTPYEKVETWLNAYADWKARLAYARIELNNIPGLTKALNIVAIHGHGKRNDTLFQTVIHRLEITEHEIPLLESRIGLIDFALSALSPEESLFVKFRYQEKLSISVAMDRLGLSRRSFFYHRKRILDKIYRKIKSRMALLDFAPFDED